MVSFNDQMCIGYHRSGFDLLIARHKNQGNCNLLSASLVVYFLKTAILF